MSLSVSRTLILLFIIQMLVAPLFVTSQTEEDITGFKNPVKSGTFGELITKLAKLITVVGMPFVVFFLILAGFYFVTAQGNAEQVAQAKKLLFWTVIGAAIIVGAWAIATAIDNFGKALS